MSSIQLVREKLGELQGWANTRPRMPLLVLGARQIGKTYLIKSFGKEHFPAIHVFNFEKNPELGSAFETNLDPKRILDELSLVIRKPISADDLIFFDEIQACPRALTSLKYFNEELPLQAIISAGSLLGVGLSIESFPVGKVQEMRMYPLTFYEFLSSLNPESARFLDQIQNGREYSPLVHGNLWQWLEKYLFCGGMPKVVESFATDPEMKFETLRRCRQIQETLLHQYMSDFAKHSGSANSLHLERIFKGISSQLGQHINDSVKRFKFSDVVPGISQYSRLATAFDWLEKASLIYKVPIVKNIKSPLVSQSKESLFKCYLFDTGMLTAMTGSSPPFLSPERGSFKGFIAENFACQELFAYGHRPFAWNAEKSSAEIEFLLESSQGMLPLEVKSGRTSKAKSIASFIRRYNPATAFIFGNTMPRTDGGSKRIPLYLIGKTSF